MFLFEAAQSNKSYRDRPSDSLLQIQEIQTSERLSTNTKSKRPQATDRFKVPEIGSEQNHIRIEKRGQVGACTTVFHGAAEVVLT